MEAHQPCSRILRAEAIFHQAIPDFARCAKLRDLFEEVVMGVEKEAQTRGDNARTFAARNASRYGVGHRMVFRNASWLRDNAA